MNIRNVTVCGSGVLGRQIAYHTAFRKFNVVVYDITATTVSGGFISTATVNVNFPVTGVSVSPTELNLSAGQTGQITKTIAPANATNQNVTWSSSNTSIATVNTSGWLALLVQVVPLSLLQRPQEVLQQTQR